MSAIELEAGVRVSDQRWRSAISAVRFDERGLVPVVVQEASTGDVLMLAYMNEESMRLTVEEARMVYWSRSRRELWRKGETSGHVQHLISLSCDCDGDTLLARVDQVGAACHTGTHTCFTGRALVPEHS